MLEERWPDMRATDCKVTIRSDDAICALITLTPLDNAWKEGKPTRAMGMNERFDQRLVWLVSLDGGKTFTIHRLLEPGTAFNGPNVETSVGANIIPADHLPGVIYFDGSKGYPGGGDYYDRSKTITEILKSGVFRQTRVFLASPDSSAHG